MCCTESGAQAYVAASMVVLTHLSLADYTLGQLVAAMGRLVRTANTASRVPRTKGFALPALDDMILTDCFSPDRALESVNFTEQLAPVLDAR
jgi:hypothetical protein